MKENFNFKTKLIVIVLRIIIGGHLFFNGLIKIINPEWSAKSYLEGSYGIFKWMASQGTLIGSIDILNKWVLLLAGAALIIGLFERIAAFAGIVLLGLYYIAYPPFNILSDISGGMGPSFIANPLLIEIVALIVIFAVPTGKKFGIEKMFQFLPLSKKPKGNDQTASKTRRDFILSLVPISFLGIFSIPFFQSKTYKNIDAFSGATSLGEPDVFGSQYKRLKELNLDEDEKVIQNKGNMPIGKIGNLHISRLIAGNSIISENYNVHDLRFIRRLANNYNSRARILMTLKSIESSGINTAILTFKNFNDYGLLDYWKEWGGKLQWISELQTSNMDKFEEMLEGNLKIGASAICISREACDNWVANNEYDNIHKALEIISKYNVPAGIGAYYNETIAFAIREKLTPDFYFKSFHKDTYWSAHPSDSREYMEIYKNASKNHSKYHHNLWCQKPLEFAEMMKDVDIPWIAFKVTTAGALPFQEGFEFAIKNGAPFVCASLYDFQVGDCIRSLTRAYKNI